MVDPKALLQASREAGLTLFRRPFPTAAEAVAHPTPVMVPIRSLGTSHRERIGRHLLALEPHDRYLRFGFAANDEQVLRYVEGLNFERDDIYGIYNRRLELIAVAHLAFSDQPGSLAAAEFGVSVLKSARGRGFGGRLFDRAVMHARNEGVNQMFIHALSENVVMLNIARKAGARVERDGSESEAYLTIEPANLDTRMSEIVQDQFAEADYHLKVQAKHFWDLLTAWPYNKKSATAARRPLDH